MKMEISEVEAMPAGPELDALVHTLVMGQKCYHLHRRPVNPNTIRHANAAKEICDDCGLRTYTVDFMRAQKQYSRNIDRAVDMVQRIAFGGTKEDWISFIAAFESQVCSRMPTSGVPDAIPTSDIILAAIEPAVLARAAVMSKIVQ